MSDGRAAVELEAGVLRSLVEGTATEVGERFFAVLVRALCSALGRHGAWVTELDAEARRLRALAFWLGDRWVDGYEYAIAGTPCEPVVDGRCLVHVPQRVVELYPRDPDLGSVGAVSYLGVPLLDRRGAVMGHLAVLDTRPMPEDRRDLAVFRIFAARAAAELQRIRAERELRAREQELTALVGGAMDGIVQMDEQGKIVRANPACERLFAVSVGALCGADVRGLFTARSAGKLVAILDEFRRDAGGQAWVPGGLRGRRSGGEFQAEATISRFSVDGHAAYTLILRDVEDRIEAERLRAELDAVGGGGDGEILGSSEATRRVLREIDEVAPTDATVLVLGETGTGKELVARAVHARSSRRERPLVCVNCAAIPAALVESELFGHEKGAFTGAAARRPGRFELADGGSLFLDEVAELPLEAQAKLLRTLQEREIEPVGGAGPRRVDVRVIAATHRDLAVAVRGGRFREDLYYRLDVFRIVLPPLRDRTEDIPVLAQALVARHARRMGRSVAPLSAENADRLKRYGWPGNVRELSNVLERAVITARDGILDLERALPSAIEVAPPRPVVGGGDGSAAAVDGVLTADQLLALERANVVRALEQARWRVAGAGGAAARLGLKPSTLTSRMRALGIHRTR